MDKYINRKLIMELKIVMHLAKLVIFYEMLKFAHSGYRLNLAH
jgi:hypothetical protein